MSLSPRLTKKLKRAGLVTRPPPASGEPGWSLPAGAVHDTDLVNKVTFVCTVHRLELGQERDLEMTAESSATDKLLKATVKWKPRPDMKAMPKRRYAMGKGDAADGSGYDRGKFHAPDGRPDYWEARAAHNKKAGRYGFRLLWSAKLADGSGDMGKADAADGSGDMGKSDAADGSGYNMGKSDGRDGSSRRGAVRRPQVKAQKKKVVAWPIGGPSWGGR